MAIEPATNRVREQFAVEPTRELPQVSCPDPLYLEAACELPDDSFYESSDALEQFEPPSGTDVLDVVPQLGL